MRNERRTGDKELHEKKRVFVLVILSAWRGGAKPQPTTPSVRVERQITETRPEVGRRLLRGSFQGDTNTDEDCGVFSGEEEGVDGEREEESKNVKTFRRREEKESAGRRER